MTDRPLGQQLVEKGLISEDQIRIALTEQKNDPAPIGSILIRLGFISASILNESLSAALGKDSIDLSQSIADPAALKLVPEPLARSHKIVPIAFDSELNSLTVAMSDITNILTADRIRASVPSGIGLKTVLANEGQISDCIDQFYGYQLSIGDILSELEAEENNQILDTVGDNYRHPIVRLVDAVLTDAVIQRASDIHLEPEQGFARVRYRIDGVLKQVLSLHKKYWPSIVVRIKILAGMNIAESRSPQDGQFSLLLSGRSVDFRASVQPTIYGENVALRILDRKHVNLDMQQLGISEPGIEQLKIMMTRPEGIILVTGPTGSGKSTTLYSLLQQINNESINIMTMEDPVEHPMQWVRQTSMTDTNKMTFADGIRSIMRQDPDVILVGEIRDSDTAEMAFRAAMTGHQVYSTLHANSAIGAIPRLLDIGVSHEILSGNIIGIVGQRLVRKLCPHCKQEHQLSEFEKTLLRLDNDATTSTFEPGPGCKRCANRGFFGRMALMEVLRFDDELDDLINTRASASEIRTLAEEKNFISLSQDGIRRVLDGSTSLDEVSRVVSLTHRR